ncbi:MAG: Bug family tripartite tricarboxylate transporter substrate binding protein [Alphaproteobacteria bacterium]
MRTTTTFGALIGGFLGALVMAGMASGQTVEEFYKGRSMELIVGSGTGGGYDVYGRLASRHMGRHIPGNPRIIVKNVVGGGGIRASNLLYNVVPKDGGTIGTVSRAMITLPLMGQKNAKFDPSKFTWIGSANNEDNICLSWHTAPVKTWEQLLKNKLIIGSAAQGTSTYTYPVTLRNMFGAQFELIAGYPDASSVLLAMQRGEVQSICISLSSIQTRHPKWLSDGSINVLVLIGLKRNPDLPKVPSLNELASSDEQKQLLKVILGPQFAGRPLLAPPSIPTERAAALRAAFMAAMKDKALLADAKKLRLDISPATGEEVADLVRDIYASPKSLIEKVQAVSVKPDDMKVTVKELPVVTVSATLKTVEKKGAVLSFDVKGKTQRARISNARTAISIKGAKAGRSSLKAGMDCSITYQGSGTEASKVSC